MKVRISEPDTVLIRTVDVSMDAFTVMPDRHMSISDFRQGLISKLKLWLSIMQPNCFRQSSQKKAGFLRQFFFSGNTDCYQPAERKLGITRKCLEVFLKFRNPLALITKNALVLRDIDIIKSLSEMNLVRVVISVTTLKKELHRVMEPRTSSPDMRLKAIEILASNNIPVSVNVAPIIPGLTDEEIPSILKEASVRGAVSAGNVILRLPHSVKELFIDWLRREFPERADKIINRIKEVHGGKLYDSNFGRRLTGYGEWADTIQKIFISGCRKYNLNTKNTPLNKEVFRRNFSDQFSMFG